MHYCEEPTGPREVARPDDGLHDEAIQKQEYETLDFASPAMTTARQICNLVSIPHREDHGSAHDKLSWPGL